MPETIKVAFAPDSLCEVVLALEQVGFGEPGHHIRVTVDCGETGFIDVTPEHLDKLESFVAICRAVL